MEGHILNEDHLAWYPTKFSVVRDANTKVLIFSPKLHCFINFYIKSCLSQIANQKSVL